MRKLPHYSPISVSTWFKSQSFPSYSNNIPSTIETWVTRAKRSPPATTNINFPSAHSRRRTSLGNILITHTRKKLGIGDESGGKKLLVIRIRKTRRKEYRTLRDISLHWRGGGESENGVIPCGIHFRRTCSSSSVCFQNWMMTNDGPAYGALHYSNRGCCSSARWGTSLGRTWNGIRGKCWRNSWISTVQETDRRSRAHTPRSPRVTCHSRWVRPVPAVMRVPPSRRRHSQVRGNWAPLYSWPGGQRGVVAGSGGRLERRNWVRGSHRYSDSRAHRRHFAFVERRGGAWVSGEHSWEHSCCYCWRSCWGNESGVQAAAAAAADPPAFSLSERPGFAGEWYSGDSGQLEKKLMSGINVMFGGLAEVDGFGFEKVRGSSTSMGLLGTLTAFREGFSQQDLTNWNPLLQNGYLWVPLV